MKKQHYLFLFTLCLLSVFSFSQVHKGTTLLGGDISALTRKTTIANTDYDQNSLLISPSIGKAIKDNFIIGISANIGSEKFEFTNGSDYKSKLYGGGIFIRKYKPLGSSGFLLFVQADATTNFSTIDVNNSSNEKRKVTSIKLSTYPGIAYTISKRVQLETGFSNLLAFNFQREKINGTTGGTAYSSKSNLFSVNTSLASMTSLGNVFAGFRFFLN